MGSMCNHAMHGLILCASFTAAFAIDVNLTGIVKDSLTQRAVAGATVSLASNPNLSTQTNTDGSYVLTGTITSILRNHTKSIGIEPKVVNSTIFFDVMQNTQRVVIDFFDLKGAKISTGFNRTLERGSYYITPAVGKKAHQFFFTKITIGSKSTFLKMTHLRRIAGQGKALAGNTNETLAQSGLAKTSSISDSLVISDANHRTTKKSIADYSGSVNVTVLANRPQALAKVTSVSPKGINAGLGKRSTTPSFTVPSMNPRFINSGSPDFLIVTLKEINLYNFDSIIDAATGMPQNATLWRGSKTMCLNGEGAIDVGDIILDSFPTWTSSHIALGFADTAKICGSLIAPFNIDTTNSSLITEVETLYTKAAYSYNAATHIGGAGASVGRYAAFKTAPAETSSVNLYGTQNQLAFALTKLQYTYDTAAAPPTLTVLFDLSKMLRFYNGCNITHTGGVNPPDPSDKAYFFCHSVFCGSIATFVGAPGQIQGYETLFNCSTNDCGVPGWMTLVCNFGGGIISGILIGDDDNDLAISKGTIDSVAGTNPYDFHYTINKVNVSNFTKATALGDTSVASWVQPVGSVNGQISERTGLARFILRFKTN